MTRDEALAQNADQIRRFGVIFLPGVGELTRKDLTDLEARKKKLAKPKKKEGRRTK